MQTDTSSASAGQQRQRAVVWLTGVLIVALALACRWWWASRPRSVRWDEADLLILARNLLQGAGYQIFGAPDLTWPPGAPLLAAAAMTAGAPADHALAVWHVIAGALAAGLLYGLARDVTGSQRTGALAGMLLAVAPALAVAPLYWGSLSEAPFVAALLAGLWAVWRWLHTPGPGAWRPALVASLAFAFSFLVRPEGIGWWALFLAVAALLALLQRRQTARAAQSVLPGRSLVIYVLAFLLAVSPYWLYLYRHSGRVQLSGKSGITAVLGPAITEQGSALGNDLGSRLDSSGQEILWLSPERFDTGPLDALMADPVAALRRVASNVQQIPGIVTAELVGLGVVSLMGLGLFARPWDRRRLQGELFVAAALLPMLAVPLFYVQQRLLVPAVPLLLIWAARGVDSLIGWLDGTAAAWPRARRLAPVLTGLLLAGLVASSLWQQRAIWQVGTAGQFPSHQAAGQWLAAHGQPGEVIMTRNSEVGLYAGRPLAALPDATWEQTLAYGMARAARYLVIDSWEIDTVRPQLSFLAQVPAGDAALELLAEFADDRRVTWVFRLPP